MDNIDDIKKTLLRLYGLWVLADFVLWGLSLLYVWAIGSLVDLLSALFISLAFGLIPFPFNILAIWQIDPSSIILQTVIFFLILAFLFLTNRDS